MASATGVEAPRRSAECREDIPSTRLARDFRWQVVGDPPPPPELTRFQRLYNWLYEFNRY